jgi:ureidoacrylate peracid hydrolase
MPEPGWNLNAENKALIIVDMQNAFCDDNGFMTRIGLNVDQCKAAVAPNKRVLERCRELDIPVIFTRYWLRPDYKDAGLFENLFPGSHQAQAMVSGTWDAEITPDLAPLEGEYVVDKQRYSAFYETNLDLILRSLGTTMVVVTGVTTNICVESTVRDAMFRDYKVTVIEDCTGAVDELMQKGAIHTFRYGFADVISSEDFIKRAKPNSAAQRAAVA